MDTNVQLDAEEESDHRKPTAIHYLVNGERQTTDHRELPVHTILSTAGFTPPGDYRLVRDDGNHTYTDPNQEVHLHDSERFTALYQGPTPTS